MGAALIWAKSALAAQQVDQRNYLVSNVDHNLPLPTVTPTPIPTNAPRTPTVSPIESPVTGENEGDAISPETPTPTTAPSTGRIVRLVIPRLGIDRSVIPIGLVRSGSKLDWNTDKLFANRNRPDLVGHLMTSVNPGDGSNIVLVGHNYNNSGYNWKAVFHNLKALQTGDRITVYTQNGGEHQYIVQKVKQVPWVNKKGSELEKHLSYIWPKPQEQLTLVTCSGANLWTWSAASTPSRCRWGNDRSYRPTVHHSFYTRSDITYQYRTYTVGCLGGRCPPKHPFKCVSISM